ncbi:hypothetical protein [Sphingopyxis sp. MWB1]|uniref:hypothetical protein n=1 Tax=Sphingopyxis sp. MWB1 TaxID=1537715 RepID=UPI00051A6BC9|nr:hypothetical protein [Sphingopyxis sp. MWB1]
MTDQNPPPPHDDDENEVLRETREMRAQQQAAAESEAARGKGTKRGGWKAAAGIGIGSAAVLAALLYASRDKNK